MISQGTLSAIRFGFGLGPGQVHHDKSSLLKSLGEKDTMAAQFPVKPTDQAVKSARSYLKLRKQAEAAGNQDADNIQKARDELNRMSGMGLVNGVARILETDMPFHERLLWFWADHFTAVPKNIVTRVAAPAYLDEAIRPYIKARFGDMLRSVVTHPFMLSYLDQVSSTGPNSPRGKRRGVGLNENLAREVLELHTLGVGSAYGQNDVRQLAELMTGLTYSPKTGFVFNHRMAEPGAETILGKKYGGANANLQTVLQAMDDLAIHPDTARHLARKLAVHFVSDNPDQSMIDHMSAAYLASGGELRTLYTAMLEHPAAWVQTFEKAKQPFDYIISTLVALGWSAKQLLKLEPKDLQGLLSRPLVNMGQPFMQAGGPDGWPEEAQAWITPQGLAARIDWSRRVAKVAQRQFSDPSKLLNSTLGDAASDQLIRAVGEISKTEDAIALIFASAEFNRR